MERFVFVVAIAIAVLFGLGAVFGGPHFNFDVDVDGGGTSPVLETSAGRLEATAFAGNELRIRHGVARVTITPEDRQDFLIEINSPGGVPMPEVSSDDARVTIDGRLRGRISDCHDDGTAELRGYGAITAENLPVINIRAPRDLVLERGGAGTTEIGATESLNIDVTGCGTVTAADIAGPLEVDLAGSGQLTTGAAQSLNADVAGSGQVTVGAVREYAQIDIAGSGTVNIGSLTGQLNADAAGSGNVNVQGGAVTVAELDLAGSGNVEIAAPVQTLNASIVGSGNVSVSNIVGDIDAEIAGSGSVSAQSVTGAVRKEVWGSGDVQVGGGNAQIAP
ncbi:MAG: DUF2807 domain-containing protein [Caulobacterales bacterium]|jgi:hypothetical protein|nr:DUF2807 domain-containing protein [Caulobacterales bacterium]